jgi:hypothetical protein
MLRTSVVALALSTGVILSGSALAEPAKFDGSWSVSLVANGGLCGSGTSSTLMVQNGSVRAGGSGVSVSGQVGPGGSVSLRIPTHAGHLFRDDVGHHSDLMPATVPR